MKKITFLNLMVLSLALIFSGCGKSDDVKLGTAKATIGGEAVNFKTFCRAVVSTKNLVLTLNNLLPPHNLTITLTDYNGAGTYRISSSDNTVTIAYISADGTFGATEGSVVITEVDETAIQGTFTFKAKKINDETVTIEATDGAFNAKIESTSKE